MRVADTPAISVDGLTKDFAGVRAVDNASFEIPFGSVTGFIGANGSGKTTTMRMLLGLTIPTSGRAQINGRSYKSLPEPRQSVGAVLNRLGAHPGLTAIQHLEIVAACGQINPSTVAPTLDLVGLAETEGRKLGTFSTGMKQRLALASALLTDPKILILDEPASGLDPGGIRWLRNLLRDKADQGTAVFISTHQLAELAELVDHIVVIDRGQILASESADSLLARTKQDRLEEAIFTLTNNQYKEAP